MYSPGSHSSNPFKFPSQLTHSHSSYTYPFTHSLSQRLDEPQYTQWSELSLRNTNCQTESKALIILGAPIGFSLATRVLQAFTDQAMVGHLGTKYLAASSMANILMTICATYIYAFCGTINVLCSQAFGAKNFPQVSEWMQLGCVLAAILSLPTFIAYAYCEQLLLMFGTSKEIAKLSGTFACWSMISILPNTQFMATRMYFKAQSNVLPATCICSIMVIFNLLINLMLVYGYGINWCMKTINGSTFHGLGFIGSPIATATTRTIQYLCYMFYMFVWKKYHLSSGTWSSFKYSTFSCARIKKFIVIAIPQTISTALEEWQIQIVALFAASLSEAELAAFSSSCTIIFACHTISVGLGDAVSVRVANFLGSNNAKYARYVAWVGIVLAVVDGVVIGGLLATVGKYLAYVVSGREEIYSIYAKIFPMIGTALFALNIFTIVVSILIAQARTVALAVSALVGCWGISVPMSYLLGIYFGYGIKGIWYGIIMGYTTFAVCTFFIFFKTDWKQCALEAAKRSKPQHDANTNLIDEIDDIDIDALHDLDLNINGNVNGNYNALVSDEFSINKLLNNDQAHCELDDFGELSRINE